MSWNCCFGPVEGTAIVGGVKPTFIVLLLWLLALERAPAEKILFFENFSNGIPASWENVTFFKKRTEYAAGRDGTNTFVRAVAIRGCSAFGTKLNLAPPADLVMRWRWKIDGVNTNASDRYLKTFDHAGRVFIAFDTFFGPPRVLDYLWGNVEKPGTLIDHPESGRIKLMVVESGNSRAGQWVPEQRDVTADWKRAFPGRKMPKIVGVGVMTDSDSLGGTLCGDYTDIELVAE